MGDASASEWRMLARACTHGQTGISEAVEKIYVELLNEGVQVWRPVPAVKLRDDVYRIEAMADGDSEEWELPPGSVVRCELRRFEGDPAKLPVAVALA